MGIKRRLISGTVRYLKGRKVSKRKAVSILVICFLCAYFLGFFEKTFYKVYRKRKTLVFPMLLLTLLFSVCFFVSQGQSVKENQDTNLREEWVVLGLNGTEDLQEIRTYAVTEVDAFIYRRS
jgi:hypothetical protein